jgi:hypothetical protein
MRRSFVLAALLLPALARADSLSDWKPLLGSWAAEVPGGKGWFTLEPGVQDRVLIRKNHAEYAATKDRPANVHDDLMVIYTEGDGTRADYYDSEGHVIHYRVTLTPSDKKAVFVSEAQAGAPRYRLTYDFATKDVLDFSFDIAAPDAPGTWKTYMSAKIHRK